MTLTPFGHWLAYIIGSGIIWGLVAWTAYRVIRDGVRDGMLEYDRLRRERRQPRPPRSPFSAG